MKPAGPPTWTPTAEDFFADIVGGLTGTLQDVAGLEGAAGFVASVGTELGRQVSRAYGADTDCPDAEAIAAVLVDFKRRVGGSFQVAEITADQIVLTNGDCPFAQRVEGRPALCMMTTAVFGRVTADANGYARVHVDKAIATGHDHCRVVIALRRDEDIGAQGHEFLA